MDQEEHAVSRIVDHFLARLGDRRQIPQRVIQGLARLATDGRLGDQSAIEAVITEGDENGEAKET